MLISLITTPLIGILTLSKIKKEITIKKIGLVITIINFIISLIIWSYFDYNTSEFQFTTNIGSTIYPIRLGIDGISLYFIILTNFIFPIVILSNWYSIKESVKSYIILILLLETLLITVFSVLNLLLFYIFFESILPPLFILIGIWGSLRKWRASYHIFLYTLLGSLLMLIGFLLIYNQVGTLDYELIREKNLDPYISKIIFILIFIAIMVKSPLWPFHLWLPLAHSEAPLGGSIILAGVILKLALYAVLRIIIPILPEASLYFTPIVYTICVITIIYASLSTIRQIDTKVIVAYSSISHMAVTMMGAFSNNIQGIEGSIILGIAHGLVSPGLFILLGGVLYDRYHTRILLYYRGLTQFMPIFSIIFFILTLANMGTPLTGNFIGEFLSLTGAFKQSPYLTSIASLSIILSAIYSIYLYNRITGGIKTPQITYQKDITRREFYILIPLVLITIIIGIYPNFILTGLHTSVSNLIYQI
jgi:NADH-ubiquinone oxidoreductase chain 4